MNMETDDKIKDVFREFSIGIKLDDSFLERLDSKLDVIELVAAERDQQKNMIKKAAVVSAFCGFCAGVILMLLYPYMLIFSEMMISRITIITPQIELGTDILAYGCISFLSILTSIASYYLFIPFYGLKRYRV